MKESKRGQGVSSLPKSSFAGSLENSELREPGSPGDGFLITEEFLPYILERFLFFTETRACLFFFSSLSSFGSGKGLVPAVRPAPSLITKRSWGGGCPEDPTDCRP